MKIDSSEIIIRHRGKDYPLSKIMDKIKDFDKQAIIEETLAMVPGYDDEIKNVNKIVRDFDARAATLEDRIREAEHARGIYR